MKLVEAVGIRLDELLREKHLTRYRIEKEGGIPRQTIAAIIQGRNKTVSLNTIYQIISTFGMSLEEFFSDSIFADVTD